MKKSLIIFGFALFFVFISINFISAAGNCTDSDGGINLYVKGTAGNQTGNFTDSCNGNVLKEFFCQSGSLQYTTTNCVYGCQNGACLQNLSAGNQTTNATNITGPLPPKNQTNLTFVPVNLTNWTINISTNQTSNISTNQTPSKNQTNLTFFPINLTNWTVSNSTNQTFLVSCMKGERNYQVGERVRGLYCDTDGILKPQIKAGKTISKNYQCKSNYLEDGKCKSLTLKNWFLKILGIKSDEKEVLQQTIEGEKEEEPLDLNEGATKANEYAEEKQPIKTPQITTVDTAPIPFSQNVTFVGNQTNVAGNQTSNQTLPTTNQTQQINFTCTDSDGGRTYSTKGSVIAKSPYSDINVADLCSDSSNLIEYFCTNLQQSGETYTCPNGCSNGACISSNSGSGSGSSSNGGGGGSGGGGGNTGSSTPQEEYTCTDSDGGRTYSTKGSVIAKSPYSDINVADLCSDSSNLIEYFCTNLQQSGETYTCPNGCSNGACIEKEETAKGVSGTFVLEEKKNSSKFKLSNLFSWLKKRS